MFKKYIFLILALACILISSVNAKTIIWVAENGRDDDEDGRNDAQDWVDKLGAAGYIVDFQPGYWETLTSALVNELNAADLVITSCTTQSDRYANDNEAELWNSVTAPLLLTSPYITRSNRWQWINYEGDLPNDGDQGAPIMQVVETTHPIFYGVTLDASDQLDALDETLGSGHASFVGSNDPGNGTLIAKTVPDSLVEDWSWIIEWNKGDTFYEGSNYTATNHRMYFTGIGFHEIDGTPMRAYNLTDEGWKLFLNAVKYMIGDPVDPHYASSANPRDGEPNVPVTNVILSWKTGESAATHNVFFGTNEADVASATIDNPLGTLLQKDYDTNSIDLGSVAYGTTYYWRVDEMPGMYVGNVWSFETEKEGIDLNPSKIIKVQADAPYLFYEKQEPNMTCDGSGLDPNGEYHTASIDEVENTMWMGYGDESGDVWIQYEFDQIYKFHEFRAWNYNEIGCQDFGAKDVNVTYSIDNINWKALDEIQVFEIAPGTDKCTADTIVDMNGAVAKYIKLIFLENFAEISGGGLSEVVFSVIPTRAGIPDPGKAATNVELNKLLSWKPGREVDIHKIYIGYDVNSVKAEIGEFKEDQTEDPNYAPTGGFALATSYYWRVDEVNAVEEYPTWDGPVWSFRTVEYRVIDNFETGYGNVEANAVYNTWIDGGDPGSAANGSWMGRHSSPYLQTIHHGGGTGHSSPMDFGRNGAADSFVTAQSADLPALESSDNPSDWSIGSPKTLTIWFRGDPNNSTTVLGDHQLYCTIGGKTKDYEGNLKDYLMSTDWKQFDVNLADLDVDLHNIPEITIGVKKVGTNTDTGVIYLDDIQLTGLDTKVAYPSILFEAEDMTIAGLWRVSTGTTGFSGTGYIDTDSAKTSASTEPNLASLATKAFTSDGGKYMVNIRYRPAMSGGWRDGIWVRIINNSGTPAATDVTLQTANGWVNCDSMSYVAWGWDTIYNRDASNVNADVTWTLPAGDYTIQLSYKDTGFRLDVVEIMKVSN